MSRYFEDKFGSITLYRSYIHVVNKEHAEDGWIPLEEELDYKKCSVYMASDIFSIHYYKRHQLVRKLVPVFLMFHRAMPKYLGNLPYPANYTLTLMDRASRVLRYLREMETSRSEFIIQSLKQMMKGWDESPEATLHRNDWMRTVNGELERKAHAEYRKVLAIHHDEKPLTKGIDTCTIMPLLSRELKKRITETNTIIYAITLTDGRKLCQNFMAANASSMMYAWLCPKHKHEREVAGVNFRVEDNVDLELALLLSRVKPEERQNGSGELHHNLSAIDLLFSLNWNEIVHKDYMMQQRLLTEDHNAQEQRLRVRPSARDADEERDIQIHHN